VFLISHFLFFPLLKKNLHTHFHSTASVFPWCKERERRKRQRKWGIYIFFKKTSGAPGFYFTTVSQALRGLWWFNSCCYKHLLRALSRSQLRLTQPGTPFLIYASAFSFFFSSHRAKRGKQAKRSEKLHLKRTLRGGKMLRGVGKRRKRRKKKRKEKEKLGILANIGSTYKKITLQKLKEQQQTLTSSSLEPSFICLFPCFFLRPRRRRRRSECWYDYVNVNRISCRLEDVFLSDPFSLQIFHLRQIPPGRPLRRYLTG